MVERYPVGNGELIEDMGEADPGTQSPGLASLANVVSRLVANPDSLKRMTTMDAKRKADLEALGIGAVSFGIGKIAPNVPATLKGLASGFIIEQIQHFFKGK